MNYADHIYSNERLDLHGNSFQNCTFKNCELVYDGDRSPTFKDNQFIDTVFVFTGAIHGHEVRTIAPHTVDHSLA